MRDQGQHEIFNFDTGDSDFEFEAERKGSITSLTFTRKREGKPDDSVVIGIKTKWIGKIIEALKEDRGGKRRLWRRKSQTRG